MEETLGSAVASGQYFVCALFAFQVHSLLHTGDSPCVSTRAFFFLLCLILFLILSIEFYSFERQRKSPCIGSLPR